MAGIQSLPVDLFCQLRAVGLNLIGKDRGIGTGNPFQKLSSFGQGQIHHALAIQVDQIKQEKVQRNLESELFHVIFPAKPLQDLLEGHGPAIFADGHGFTIQYGAVRPDPFRSLHDLR